MNFTPIKNCAGLMLFAALATSGCGGSGGIDGTGAVSIEISGTAALGLPIANATVTFKAADGSKNSTTTGATGKFNAVVTSSKSGASLLRVSLPNGNTLYSIASGNGTTNIHPFTDLIVRNWFKGKNIDINAEFENDIAISQLPTVDQVNAIKSAIKELFALILAKYNLPTDFDLLSSAFDANGSGFDNLLDKSHVVIINNTITVNVNDPITNIDASIINNVGLGKDFTQTDLIPPSQVMGVRVVPASDKELIVLWSPADDNVGVAGYRVYRSDLASPITTPFPVLSDTSLNASTQYCYQVEAFDARNNITNKSTSVCGTTLAVPDTTPPAAAQNLKATALNAGTIALNWAASSSVDTVSYEINRGPKGLENTKIAAVTTTDFTNINLSSSTEYCYTVYAYDAARNKSLVSNEACATTPAAANQPISNSAASVEFASSAYAVSEADATVLITVNRNGDASAAASVGYRLQDGTATAGADYVSTSGVLSWGANDTAPKSFLVQVKGDMLTEGNETVQLALSNPAGLSLGTNANATLTISDAPCSGELSLNITTNTRISNVCTVVTTDVHVLNNATLTIDPGVTLVFRNNAGFYIEQDGALTANGSQTKPILFTAENQTAGWWRGVLFYQSTNNNNRLSYVTVEYGGGRGQYDAAIAAVGYSQPVVLAINNSRLTDSSSYGFYFDGDAQVSFANNLITRNKLAGYSAFNLTGLVDANSKYSGNVVDAIVVDSGTSAKPQIWPAIDADYLMSGVNQFSLDASLTILPGARLVFESGRGLSVNQSGSLNAVGTAEKPIIFTGKSQTPGYWRGILFYESNSINNKLEHVVVSYGGSGGQYEANVSVVASSTPALLKVANCSLSDSFTYGFYFQGSLAKIDFKSNNVTRNRLGAGYLEMDIAGLLDAASNYSGNGLDGVIVDSGSGVSTVQTWPGIKVNYIMRGVNEHVIAAGGHLTIQPGATLVFESGRGLTINAGGSLTAQGTAKTPIRFTASSPTKGYWRGLFFNESNEIGNVLDYVTVEYGGSSSRQYPGNISVTGYSSTILRVTNSVIQQSLTNGILISGTNVDINAVQSIGANNTFTANAADITRQ